ncbi:hypothetical protein JCM9957A_62390 [Kineosporia succinea]
MDPLDSVLRTTNSANAGYELLSGTDGWSVRGPAPRGATRVALVDRGEVTVTAQALPGLTLVAGQILFAGAGPEYLIEGSPGAVLHSLSLEVEALSAEPVLRALPQVLKLDETANLASSLSAVIRLIAAETDRPEPGGAVITARLADVVYVSTVRAAASCFADGTWLALLHDDRLARAVRAAHDDLARPWTVAELARCAGMSRSAFAAAFRSVSGQGPLEHLTWWRIHRAKHLLRSTDLDLTGIGGRVGFSSGTALSRAFRRHTGVSPMHWRKDPGA